MASVARYNIVPSMIREQDDDFLQVLDEDTVLNGLRNETCPEKRTAILESLRNSVRRSGGRLHIQERFSLFNSIHNVLLDNDVNTRLACLNFICEVIPDFGNDLDDCMGLILPQLVVFIGHNQVSVKKLAVQTLHVYMKHSENLDKVLNAIIQLGLQSENKDTQTESLIALPILITPNFADEDLFLLTEALVQRIAGNSSCSQQENSSGIADTTSLAMISLDRIRNVVGKRNFEQYIQKLSPKLQDVLANAMKVDGSSDKQKTRKAKSASGVPYEETESDSAKLDRCFTIAGLQGHKTTLDSIEHDLYLPSGVMKKLRDSDWHLKMHGIGELSSWLEQDMKPAQFLPYLNDFFGILKELLQDSNFKVNLTSLQLVGTLVDRLGTHIQPILEMLVSILANKLGDNKNVMKQTNMQVFKKLMQNLSPTEVLKVLKVNVKHRNSRVREETLNVMIAALLTFPSTEFNLALLTADIAPALIDPKRRVRHAALEAFAVISQAMGPRNLQPLVSVVDDIELRLGGDGVMAAVQARFARRQLPKVNSDGLVEYAIPLPSATSAKGGTNLSPRGADVEWVLAGGSSSDCPSSARSTPGSDSGMSASPRRHFSAGKNRLPWENGERTSNGPTENNTPKVRSSWEDKPILKPTKNLKDGVSYEQSTSAHSSSYADKYSSRKTSMKSTDESTSSVALSYAHLHKTKLGKSQVASLLTNKAAMKGSGLGPIVKRTNGYSLIYKKGTLASQVPHGEHNRTNIDANNNPNKPLGRSNASVEVKPLGHFDSHLSKSQREKNKQHPFGMNPSLTASLPDWSNLPSRSRKLLSPVSPNGNHDDDGSSLTHGHTYDSPIQTKPALARSASKKGRMLKSIDFSEAGSSSRISNTSSPTQQLSPVPPREPMLDNHRHSPRHTALPGKADSSDHDHESSVTQNRHVGHNTWSPGARKNDEDSVPFDKKPRIARTPVHLKRRSSTEPAGSDVLAAMARTNVGPDTSDMMVQGKSRAGKKSEHSEKDKKDMEIVGHAFDTSEKRMQSTLNSTSGLGSSLEESGEIVKHATRNIAMLDEPSDNNNKDEDTRIEDIDDYEFEYEDDTESGDDSRRNSNISDHVNSSKLLKDYEDHVDELDQADLSSESMYDDSDGESLEDSDGFSDDDEDEEYGRAAAHRRPVVEAAAAFSPGSLARDQRQSLSKSTRERMERKRFEEEERIMRERQRIEELERQNQLRMESKEQSFRDKLAKEQMDIENLIKKKEKEREFEKLKQEKLQKQLEKKREDALKEDYWRSKSHLEEIERLKEAQRDKERAEKLKKLHQRRDTVESIVNGTDGVNKDYTEDLTVHGHQTPSKPTEVVHKPPVRNGSVKKKTFHSERESDHGEHFKRNAVMISGSSSSLPTWEIPGSELKPFSSGDAALKSTLNLLADPENWEAKCEGLLNVRRLIRHHTHDVITQLHVLILAVVAEVQNLRSQVSRAAMYTLADMFTCLEKHMDLDLEKTTNVLLKRAGDSNAFIRSDGEHALSCLVSSVTASKAICALVAGGAGHRNVNIRKTAAQFLCMLCERMGPTRCLSGSKDITEKIVVTAAAFASDNGAVTRYYGRRILHILDSHGDFERMLAKHLTSKQLNPTMTIVENLRTKGLGDLPSDASSARVRKVPVNSGVGSRSSSIVSSPADGAVAPTSDAASPHSATSRESSRRHTRRVSQEATTPQDQEELASLAQQFTSSDWKERMQAVDKLVEWTENRPSFVSAHFVKILDGFAPRLTDNNSKVNLHALQSLLTIVPLLKDNLNGSVSTLIPHVAKNMASKNNSLVSITEDILESFIKYVDNLRLVQPLCQFISVAAGGVRSRPSAIIKLAAVVSDVYPRKPSIVLKHVLPLLWSLLQGSGSSATLAGGNTKDALKKLTQQLYAVMGESLVEYAQAKSQRIAQKLKETLDT